MTRLGPYEENSIVVGHNLDVLRQIPDGVFQVCVTSPPYFGLRNYDAPTSIWGGDATCEHDWDKERTRKQSPQRDHAPDGGFGNTRGQESWRVGAAYEISAGSTCTKCGAWAGCIGNEPNPGMYVAHLVEVFREVRRVMRPDAVCFVNLGDSFATNPGNGRGGETVDGGTPHRSGRDKTNMGIAPKNLVGIPWSAAFALRDDGWILRRDIIWAKSVSGQQSMEKRVLEAALGVGIEKGLAEKIVQNLSLHVGTSMPESVTDRPSSSHEYIFMLTKSGSPTFWVHRDKAGTRKQPKPDYRWAHVDGTEVAVEPENWKKALTACPKCGGSGQVDSFEDEQSLFALQVQCPRCAGEKEVRAWKRINLWAGDDYYYDQEACKEPLAESSIERAEYAWNGAVVDDRKLRSSPEPTERLGERFAPEGGRNLRSVWAINPRGYKEAHFATFAPEIPEMCILLGSSEKGCCPKCGAPWARRAERNTDVQDNEVVKSEKALGGVPGLKPGSSHDRVRRLSGANYEYVRRGTNEWSPTCDCGCDDTVPCLVLDPFAGSGTTLAVAKELGRNYLGIDIVERYKPLAEQRIAKAVRQYRMEGDTE